MEVSNLSDAEFKTLVIRTLQELRTSTAYKRSTQKLRIQ